MYSRVYDETVLRRNNRRYIAAVRVVAAAFAGQFGADVAIRAGTPAGAIGADVGVVRVDGTAAVTGATHIIGITAGKRHEQLTSAFYAGKAFIIRMDAA
jgi:hypothetical protein